MKKIILSAILFFVSLSFFAQEKEPEQKELKINMSNLIGFKWLDASYEQLLSDESSFGVGALVSLDNQVEAIDSYRTFSITPYYRQFFSTKYAQGFFVEAFTMLHSGKDYSYLYADFPPYMSSEIVNNYTDLAVGISVGGKWVTKRGFVAEVYAGIGRDLLNQSPSEVVGRGGISIGYRFQ